METTYDVIVMGAGAVGENAADSAARAGLRVAIVEEDLVGGECSYWACMPSKTLLNPGKLVEAARRAPGAAEAVSGKIDVEAALQRRDGVVHDWDDSAQVEWLESRGIDLWRGHARLTGERMVAVAGPAGESHQLRATKAVVIATGSLPDDPGIEGIEDVLTWNSRDITSAEGPPGQLLFVGGGVVGVEMGQAWAWLGSRVTIVHNSGLLLKGEEPFVGEELRAALEYMGVTVVTGATAERVDSHTDGTVTTTVRHSDGSTDKLDADEVVVATGRRARTDALGLESVGLTPGRFLPVDEHMRVEGVDGEWLYAVGDVNGRALFTHVGKYEARIAGDHIGGVPHAAVSDIPAVPRVIFTSPEIAAVGLTEAEARDAGMSVDAVTHDLGQIAAGGVLGKGYSGTCKLVIDRKRQVLAGATFVGPHVAELLHSATIAIVGQVPIHRLWHAVPSFPTFSEVWLRLLEEYRDTGWDPYSASPTA